MPGHVHVQCLTVGEFLGGDRRVVLPWFQRSYAWGERQIGRLVSDLRTAMTPGIGRQRYFLGQICLARAAGETIDQLIDGNQRITTLTIIFSILRDLADNQEMTRLHEHVAVPRTEGADNGPRLRLSPQPSVAPFLERYVQTPGSTRATIEEDLMSLSHTERAIFNNREDIKSWLEAMEPAERASLADFICNRCCLTVSSVDDPDEAWDMLATAEETGLDHHDTDRAKHSLLAPMPRGQQQEAARIWDTWVARIGRDKVHELLGHIRTLELGRRSTKPIEEDLIRVCRLDQSGVIFLENKFVPRAAWLARVSERTLASGIARERIAGHLETLSWLEQPLWVAPVLHWLEQRGDQDDETVDFFFRLDRLAWLLKLAGVDPVTQQRDFIDAVKSIGSTGSAASIRALEPDAKVVKDAIANLRSRTFEAKRYSDLVLRRLSLALGRDSGPLDPEGLTVEHILPRNPMPGSDWWRSFRSRAQVAEYTNRLGNLALLTRPENQLASTKGYAEKRRILAGSDFVLARDAAEATEWTSETIRSRTERLIAILLETWKL